MFGFIILLLCGRHAAAAEVRLLTTENFDEVTRKAPLVLVSFVAPWCGHCKALKPELAKAARSSALGGSADAASDLLAVVDTVENEQLYYRFDIQSFPTMKLFRFGAEAAAYEGERSAAGIEGFLLAEQAKDPRGWAEATDFDAFEAAASLHAQGPSVLLLAPSEAHPSVQQLTGAAISPRMAKAKTWLLAGTAADAAAKRPNVAALFSGEVSLPALLVRNPWEAADAGGGGGGLTRMKGASVTLDAERIIEFTHQYGWPLVVPFSQANKPLMFEKRPGYKVHLLAFGATIPDNAATGTNNMVAGLRAVATKHRGEAIFISVDTSDTANRPMMDELQVVEPLPALRLIASDAKKQRLLRYRAAPFDAKGAAEHAEALSTSTAGAEATIDAFIAAINTKALGTMEEEKEKHDEL